MANNTAFTPMGKTINIVTNAATANNLTMTSDSPCQQYRIANHASQPVYVWISAASSPVNVAVPTGNGAKAQYALVIPNGSVSVVEGPPISSSQSVQVSAIAETGTPDIYVTPGEGMA